MSFSKTLSTTSSSALGALQSGPTITKSSTTRSSDLKVDINANECHSESLTTSSTSPQNVTKLTNLTTSCRAHFVAQVTLTQQQNVTTSTVTNSTDSLSESSVFSLVNS